MARKRSMISATLSLGNLSNKFSMDEDLVETNNYNQDTSATKSANSTAEKPVTQKQLKYLETLMSQHNTSPEAMNKYVKATWNIDDYKKINGVQASALIEKFKAIE